MTDIEQDLRDLFARDALDYDSRSVGRIATHLRHHEPTPPRRWGLVAASVAAVAATSTGIWGIAHVTTSQDETVDPTGPSNTGGPTSTSTAQAPGVVIAAGQVALTVPAPWVDHPTYECSRDTTNTVLFVSNERADCSQGIDGGAPTTIEWTTGPAQADGDNPLVGTGNREPQCGVPPSGTCTWSTTLGPTTVTITGPDNPDLRSLIASARPLAPTEKAVPALLTGLTVEEAQGVIEQAGLTVSGVATSRGIEPGPALITSTDPISGTVLSAGDAVSLEASTTPATNETESDLPVLGSWNVQIVGVIVGGVPTRETFRDIDMPIRFNNDGTIDGYDGCSQFTGTYATDGQNLRFYNLVADDTEPCARPTGLLDRLQLIRTGNKVGAQLQLSLASGEITLVLKPE